MGSDGSLVEYDEKLRANIKRENMHKAYEFIRSLGAGDLIKNEIKMQFGKGQDEDAVPAFFHSGLINFFRKIGRKIPDDNKTFIYTMPLEK